MKSKMAALVLLVGVTVTLVAWNTADQAASDTWEITGQIIGCELFLVAVVEPVLSKPGYTLPPDSHLIRT